MTTGNENQLTRLLARAQDGDSAASEALIEQVYSELRRLANRIIHQEAPGHTLQATALVHEAYIRLFGQPVVRASDSAHFFNIAARQMRRILVDHARSKNAGKRRGVKIALESAPPLSAEIDPDVIVVSELLDQLAESDEDAARVVELRFFGGYTEEEVAAILGSSLAKVRRDWEFARAWIYHRTAG